MKKEKRWHPERTSDCERYFTIIPMRFPLPNRLKIHTTEKRKRKQTAKEKWKRKNVKTEVHAGRTADVIHGAV